METERLILRRWEEEGLHDLHRYAQDREVALNAGWQPSAIRKTCAPGACWKSAGSSMKARFGEASGGWAEPAATRCAIL